MERNDKNIGVAIIELHQTFNNGDALLHISVLNVENILLVMIINSPMVIGIARIAMEIVKK